MVTGILLGFLGTSCLASVVVFAACAASARADEIQRLAFTNDQEETELYPVEERRKALGNVQLALNPKG